MAMASQVMEKDRPTTCSTPKATMPSRTGARAKKKGCKSLATTKRYSNLSQQSGILLNISFPGPKLRIKILKFLDKTFKKKHEPENVEQPRSSLETFLNFFGSKSVSDAIVTEKIEKNVYGRKSNAGIKDELRRQYSESSLNRGETGDLESCRSLNMNDIASSSFKKELEIGEEEDVNVNLMRSNDNSGQDICNDSKRPLEPASPIKRLLAIITSKEKCW